MARRTYAREHTWHLAGGAELKATDAGAMLPLVTATRSTSTPLMGS